MIQNVHFDGYRLLDNFEADLGPLTVVIGANATGKTSLLDALALVCQGVDYPIEDVITFLGGMWSIPNLGRECDEIGWKVTFSKPIFHPLWSRIPIYDNTAVVYEARLGRHRSGGVIPRFECLRYENPRPGKDSPFKFLEAGTKGARLFDPNEKKLVPFDEPDESTLGRGSKSAQSNDSASSDSPSQRASMVLSHMRFEHQYPTQTWVRAYLASACFYTGFDVGRGSPVRTKAAEIRVQTALNANGDNLGTVLHELLSRHELKDLASDLREFVGAAYPQVEHISAETAFGGEPRVLVRIKELGLRRPTEIWELSDGFLRFLLLCTALLNPVPGLIALDEPEAGLHPKLLPIVADLIRSASERNQVLVTTHSPQLLNSFELDHIAVLAREGAQARWNRPSDRAGLRKMLESQLGGTIGDLHVSGELEAL